MKTIQNVIKYLQIRGETYKYDTNRRDNHGDFFPLPKSIFRLGLGAGEIAIYSYLMYCEDRKIFQCHPSYATIGNAGNMSNNTVKK